MKLDEFFTVENDRHSWTLTYRKEGELNEKGNPKITSWSHYHSRLKHALEDYVDQSVKPAPTAEAILEELKLLGEKIDNLCK